MDYQLDTRPDPLDEVTVPYKQNLITSYVFLCYNMLFDVAERLAQQVTSQVHTPRLTAWVHTPEYDSDGNPTTPPSKRGYIHYTSKGPTEWDDLLYDENMSVGLKLKYALDSCSVEHTLKSTSTVINDALNDDENEQIESARQERDRVRRRLGLPPDDSAFEDPNFQILPRLDYIVESRTEIAFKRSVQGFTAASRLSFSFEIKSDPDNQPTDYMCELTFTTESFLFIDKSSRMVLTSFTQVSEYIEGDYIDLDRVHAETPVICIAQTMDEKKAFALADNIVVNYTALINIIAISLILFFGTS